MSTNLMNLLGQFGQNGDQRNPLINPRMIIAGIIAIVGVISYLASTQKNPVTGESQRVAMNVDQEKALGLQAAPQMIQQMGGEVEASSPEAQLVQEVGNRLVERSRAKKSPYVGNFKFHLLRDSKTINAFALPGGQIFITRALLVRLPDEAALAGVLGHEIGHVIHRHGAEHMAKGKLGQALVTAVAVGGDNQGGNSSAAVAQMVNNMIQLRYGRGDETESDHFGVEAMAACGYDPRGILDVMKVLMEASKGQKQPEWTSSHPLPENRYKDLQVYIETELPLIIQEHYPQGVPKPSRGRAFRVGDSSTDF